MHMCAVYIHMHGSASMQASAKIRRRGSDPLNL